jgi:glycosyltransferase involved in cell wall biosynthesis
MRVLLVNDYATPTAGAELITRHLRDQLNSRGHQVRVFASRAQLIAGESFADATAFGTNMRLQTLTSTWNPSAVRALKRELRAFPPDVVHVQMFLWQLSPLILPLLETVPSIYYTMTYKTVCPTGLKWLPTGVPCVNRAGVACLRQGCLTMAGFGPLMVQRYLWRRNRHALSAVIGSSNAVRHQLEADGVAVHGVIWPGTPVVRPRAPLSDPPTVTYAGRLAPEKGVEVLIRAFRRAQERCPNARLLIAGSGPEESALRALVTQVGMSDAIELHGQLANGRLHALLNRGWVHAVPSRWPEPFGLTATESMMRGTAVITSDIGGLAESVVQDVTGLRVVPGDEIALADALGRVLADRALAERLGAAGRRRALDFFSIEQCVSQFETLYAALGAGEGRSVCAN